MKKKTGFILLGFLLLNPLFAGNRVFDVQHPDFQQSPYTGMTRDHWKQAAVYLLEGAFSYVHQPDDPMKFPKQDGKSYPRTDDQVPTEKLEGLCRTLFIAAPLLKEDSNLVINHIRLADYYRHQIALLVDPMSPSCIQLRDKKTGPHQNLVEFGALSISLFIAPEILWNPLTIEQKNKLAATMLSYADGPTHANNWKFFNIFIFSYFKSRGYAINETLFNEYLTKTLAHYRSEGWYNDNPSYDYYSMWAFQMYGMLWREFYGKKYAPELADSFVRNFSPMKDNYPYLFGRDGSMIMWGRSISYRFGAIVPFPMMGFENSPETNYGWMRRIASGALLQFLKRPDLLKDGIPTLGFYGPFEPAVQSYSCRGSVFWCGKAFLGLLVPADNAFWKATENEGDWSSRFSNDKVVNRFEKASGILITDYPQTGMAELRSVCNAPSGNNNENYRGNENYNRLSYNSAFPWQADGVNGEVAMNYVVKNKKGSWEPLRMYTFLQFDQGIYYRNAVLESDRNVRFGLADWSVPNGIVRVDKISTNDSIALRLGHYALPELKSPIKTSHRKIKGYEIDLLDNGVYQLALVRLKGWDGAELVSCSGLHPESQLSKVLNTQSVIKGTSVLMTAMLWKKSGESWSDRDFCIPEKMDISNDFNTIKVRQSGKTMQINFTE